MVKNLSNAFQVCYSHQLLGGPLRGPGSPGVKDVSITADISVRLQEQLHIDVGSFDTCDVGKLTPRSLPPHMGLSHCPWSSVYCSGSGISLVQTHMSPFYSEGSSLSALPCAVLSPVRLGNGWCQLAQSFCNLLYNCAPLLVGTWVASVLSE